MQLSTSLRRVLTRLFHLFVFNSRLYERSDKGKFCFMRKFSLVETAFTSINYSNKFIRVYQNAEGLRSKMSVKS